MVVDLFGGEETVGISEDYNPIRSKPPRPADMTLDERAELIESNPDYGIVVCACEDVTKGEVLHALRREIRSNTADGIRRRTGAGMGRCQGSLCCPYIIDIIARESRIQPCNVKRGAKGGDIVYGSTKELMVKKSNDFRQPGTKQSDSIKQQQPEINAGLRVAGDNPGNKKVSPETDAVVM